MSNDRVRHLFISQRKCRQVIHWNVETVEATSNRLDRFSFRDESNLPHFPSLYSKSLCKVQCKIDKIVEACDCLPHFYGARPNERLCGHSGLRCVDLHRSAINEAFERCPCLENCEDVKFDVKSLSTSPWLRNRAVRIELEMPQYRIRREVLYTITDVLGLPWKIHSGDVISFILFPPFCSFDWRRFLPLLRSQRSLVRKRRLLPDDQKMLHPQPDAMKTPLARLASNLFKEIFITFLYVHT